MCRLRPLDPPWVEPPSVGDISSCRLRDDNLFCSCSRQSWFAGFVRGLWKHGDSAYNKPPCWSYTHWHSGPGFQLCAGRYPMGTYYVVLFVSDNRGPMRAPGRNAPLIRVFWFRWYIYCSFVYIVGFFFCSLFLTYLFPHLSFPLKIDPLRMRAFVVLNLVFSIPSPKIGLRKRLQNDLFCVEWDVKPQLNH